MRNYFAFNLSALRKARNITQQELANQLEKGQSTIAGWENGSSEPNIDLLIRLSDIFNMSIDELVKEDMRHGKVFKSVTNREIEEVGKGIGNVIGKVNRELPDDTGVPMSVISDILATLKSIDQNIGTIMKNKEL